MLASKLQLEVLAGVVVWLGGLACVLLLRNRWKKEKKDWAIYGVDILTLYMVVSAFVLLILGFWHYRDGSSSKLKNAPFSSKWGSDPMIISRDTRVPWMSKEKEMRSSKGDDMDWSKLPSKGSALDLPEGGAFTDPDSSPL